MGGNGLALYRTRYGAKGAVTPTIVTEVDTATNPANTSSTSRSARTAARATPPPASASASRATLTTTATSRTCSPCDVVVRALHGKHARTRRDAEHPCAYNYWHSSMIHR